MVIKPHLEREKAGEKIYFSNSPESLNKCPAIARVVDNAGPLPWKTMAFLHLFQIQLSSGQKLDMLYVCFSKIHALGPDSQRVLIIEQKIHPSRFIHDMTFVLTRHKCIQSDIMSSEPRRIRRREKLVLALPTANSGKDSCGFDTSLPLAADIH